MKRVLVTEPLHEAGMSLLQARSDIEIVCAEDARPETLSRLLPGVNGIAVRSAKLPSELLATANELAVVSRHGVGCDNVAVTHLTERRIPVAIASGANAQSVAEHTLMMMLTLARRLPQQESLLRDGRWKERDTLLAKDLTGSKALIVGFGRIGRRVAPLCKAFGMDVVVADIALDAELAESMGCRGVSDFRSELADADFLTLHVPLDESTRHIVSTAELEAIKAGAIVINCARGGVVDEVALVTALDSGKVGGAGFDVFGIEPPPGDHPLFGRPDAILTPHNAAASYISMHEMARMTAQNILDCFDGCLRDDCIFNLESLKNGS